MYIKSDDGYLYLWTHFPDYYKTQEMCENFISKHPSLLKYCPDRYKTCRMCEKALDDSSWLVCHT